MAEEGGFPEGVLASCGSGVVLREATKDRRALEYPLLTAIQEAGAWLA